MSVTPSSTARRSTRDPFAPVFDDPHRAETQPVHFELAAEEKGRVHARSGSLAIAWLAGGVRHRLAAVCARGSPSVETDAVSSVSTMPAAPPGLGIRCDGDEAL